MTTLNDYIGSLVSSITNARVMSDVQTIKVAEEYAKHDLLKHFSVPRMRIDDIEMTIPVALDEISENKETDYEPVDNTKINTLVYKELVNSVGLSSLPGEISKLLRAEIAKQTKMLEHDLRIARDAGPLKNYSKNLSIWFVNMINKSSKIKATEKRKINPEALPAHLENRLSKEIKVTSPKQINFDLNVIVEAHKLREQKPENIIYIKLKISEDGMEWNRTENNNGDIEAKLLPE